MNCRAEKVFTKGESSKEEYEGFVERDWEAYLIRRVMHKNDEIAADKGRERRKPTSNKFRETSKQSFIQMREKQ